MVFGKRLFIYSQLKDKFMLSIRSFFRKTTHVVSQIEGFREGQILKMAVASRSHVRHPYYVLVTYYNENAIIGEIKMTTTIPGEHSLNMIVGSNWEYHRPRMTIMGTNATHGYLLKNQLSLVRSAKSFYNTTTY